MWLLKVWGVGIWSVCGKDSEVLDSEVLLVCDGDSEVGNLGCVVGTVRCGRCG